jgi:electron transfer flavoprotein beta subunit
MNIIVCYKVTPDAEDIEAKADRSISVEKAEWNIGEYDLMAVEAGVALAESVGGAVSALSLGPNRIAASKAKKDILSRGPDDLYLVADDALVGADTAATASLLAKAIGKRGEFDLVICGEGSSDLYFQQVGLQLGERLGVPTVNAVSKIEVEDGKLVVERVLEREVQVLEVPLPAVISVTTDINQPRLPTMKEILKAGKKPTTEWSLADLEAAADEAQGVEVLSTLAPPAVDRRQVVIKGEPDKAVAALIGHLSKEGVL